MPVWSAIKVQYGSGHSLYNVHGYLLVDVPTGSRIISTRYFEVAYIKLWRRIIFEFLKFIFKFVSVVHHPFDFSFQTEM